MRSFKTPPSLNWLIKKRAALLGEISFIEKHIPAQNKVYRKKIERVENYLEELQYQREKNWQIIIFQLPKYKAQLEAIDTALGMHDIQIDKTLIAPVRKHKSNEKNKLPYGEVTRIIYEYFRIHPGQASTVDLVKFISIKHGLNESNFDMGTLLIKMQTRLSNLARKGLIIRHHILRGGRAGIWSMPPR